MERNNETVLVLRTCSADMTSHGGFTWPESGPVKAPDWNPKPICGYGLHGLLWGEGGVSYLSAATDAKWLVVEVAAAEIVSIDGDKVKFPHGTVVFCGERSAAVQYIVDRAPAGKRIHFATITAGDYGTATAGDKGTATAGDSGTATAGYKGTATAGDSGTATAGDKGTATAGDSGTATAGYSGIIAILHWNGKRYKMRVATVKDADGDGELEPNVPYRLDEQGNFVRAK